MKPSHRPSGAALILGALAASSVGCGSEPKKAEASGPTLSPVANDAVAELPVDATPSPDGKEIYLIASSKTVEADGLGARRDAAIYKVSASGGPITKLHQGEPLVAPFGVTISEDGQTLFVADPAAATSDERSDGAVFTMSVSGGPPGILPGTERLSPGGVEVMGSTLYITGRKEGQAGLFTMGLGGGTVTTVAAGDAFVDPTGVAVAASGDAYVVDSGSTLHGAAMASVVKVFADGRTEVLVEGIAVGHPGGVALSANDKTLFVSGLDPAKATDVVFTVDLTTRAVGRFTQIIENFTESAGLHRARKTNVFAWADSHANGTGTVYVLRLP
jgi:sugar lactone lactonase YvrE